MILVAILIISKCLASRLPLRIYGGIDANPSDYPYVVRLESQQVQNFTNNNTIIAEHLHLCSGSAISPVWVLTAAHCVYTTTFWDANPILHTFKMIIRYGHVEHSPWVKDSFSEVLETIIHPLFERPLLGESHDIQLIKTSPMKISKFIKISAVDYKTFYGQEAIIAGFGLTTKTDPAGKVETKATLDFKKPVQILTVMVNKCLSKFRWDPKLCAVAKCGTAANSCPGDSGGPILHSSGLIGVTSNGPQTSFCKQATKTKETSHVVVLVPVSPYIEWIYSYVKAS